MKRLTSILVFGLALVLSCTKEGPTTVNQITDLYTAPADATAVTLSSATSTWSTDRRYFDLNFGTISTTLVGYDALLTPGQYVVGSAFGGDQIGNAINTKVNGQDASKGFFTVNRQDNQYQITATLNDQVYFWTGSLPFTPDPAPTMLTVVQQAQSNVPNGNNSLTMQLATEGISSELDWSTWQTVWHGEGGYLALDIYSEDGYLHEGVYTASAAGGVINPGEFGIGWDPGDIYGIGMEFTDWGTCWWAVKDGAATATKITGGIITVNKVDGGWEISWGESYPEELVFIGEIPSLTKPEKPDGPVTLDYSYTIGEPQACSTSSGEVVSGVMKYPFTLVDANAQVVAYLEFVMAEGATDIEPGEYVSTEYASAAGQLANGYFLDFGDWGTFAGGSYYIDGAGEKVYIDPGVTVSVEAVGTGAFKFSSDGFLFAAAGPNYVPGGEDVGDAVPAKDVVTEQGAGVDKHSITIGEGDNIVAYFELLTATGADFVGSFVSTEYAAEPGMLCNGYSFPDWGIFGGSYVMVDGARQDVAPGETVEVTNVSGNVYKFVCSSGLTFVADVAK